MNLRIQHLNINLNINWGFNTWKLVPDIPDYKLEFMTQKFKNLDEIQHTEIFAVVKFWSGKITEFSR